MKAQPKTNTISLRGSESKDHKSENNMIKVITAKGFDLIKASMLNYYIKSGYVQALA